LLVASCWFLVGRVLWRGEESIPQGLKPIFGIWQ
jgi:hypothetical protein